MNNEFRRLTPEQWAAVNTAIALVRENGGRQTVVLPDRAEAYAYPVGVGRIAWGFNRASDGFNIARGVTE